MAETKTQGVIGNAPPNSLRNVLRPLELHSLSSLESVQKIICEQLDILGVEQITITSECYDSVYNLKQLLAQQPEGLQVLEQLSSVIKRVKNYVLYFAGLQTPERCIESLGRIPPM